MPLITGLVGWCLLYALFEFRTKGQDRLSALRDADKVIPPDVVRRIREILER